MLRIFLILSLAVALAGVGFSFVLRDKVVALSEQRDTYAMERDQAISESNRAQQAEREARAAEAAAQELLESTQIELTNANTRLGELENELTARSQELEETRVARDTAQRELARWEALNIRPNEIAALQAEARRLQQERDAFAEEKRVMGREIARLTEELQLYRGEITEVQMPDVRGQITGVNADYQFVTLDRGSEDGLKPSGKMIVTRGGELIAKVQLVRVDPRTAVANLLPGWDPSAIRAGDQVLTSYEALPR